MSATLAAAGLPGNIARTKLAEIGAEDSALDLPSVGSDRASSPTPTPTPTPSAASVAGAGAASSVEGTAAAAAAGSARPPSSEEGPCAGSSEARAGPSATGTLCMGVESIRVTVLMINSKGDNLS